MGTLETSFQKYPSLDAFSIVRFIGDLNIRPGVEAQFIKSCKINRFKMKT